MRSFVRPPELGRLRSAGRFFPRSIQNEDEEIPPFDLVNGIVREVENWEGRGDTSFKGTVVEVANGDGMSWSAQAVFDDLQRRFPSLRLIALDGFPRANSLPAIADVVGTSRALTLAADRKLCRRYIPFALVVATRICLALALAIGAVAKILLDSQVALARLENAMLLAGAVGVAGLLERTLTAIVTKRSEEAVQELIAAIREHEAARTSEYWNWISDLASELARFNRSRVVVVEDLQGQDVTTRQVVTEYFDSQWRLRQSSEYWVIFEHTTGERLRTGYVMDRKGGAYGQLEFFRQEFLNADDRRKLAEVVGHPERAALSTVLAICGPEVTRIQWIRDVFKRYEDSAPASTHLTLLYLRAMESPNLSGAGSRVPPYQPQMMSWRTFAKWAPDGVIAGPAQPGTITARAALFKAVFGRSLSREEFDQATKRVDEEFASCIDRDRDDFAVTTDVAQWLWSSWQTLNLPPPAVAKAYWVLTLFERLRAADSRSTRRIAAHLTDLDVDALQPDLITLAGPDLYGDCLHVFDRCVDACIVDEVVPLARRLVSFARLHPQDEKYLDRAIVSLTRAYSLLADDALLQAFADLVQGMATPPKPEYDRLLNLYIGVLGPDARPLYRVIQKLRTTSLGSRVADYLDARAFWLVATFGRLAMAHSREPKALGMWNWAGFAEQFAATARRISNRFADNKTITDLDLATVTMNLWSVSTAVSFGLADPAVIGDLLAAASNALNVPRPEFRGRARTSTFLSDALAIELRAVARAAVHLLERAGTAIPTTLAKHCAECDRDWPTAANDGQGHVIDWLALNAIVWNHLGFHSLAAIAELRRLELEDNALGIDEEQRSVRDDVIATITRTEARGVFHTVLANLIVAFACRGAAEVSLLFLKRGAKALTDIGAVDGAVNPLRLIAVLRRDPSRESMLSILASSPAHSTIYRYIQHVGDEELPFIVLALSNAASVSGTWTEVMAEVRRSCKDRERGTPDSTRELIEVLELKELARRERSTSEVLNWLLTHSNPIFTWERPALLNAIIEIGWWSDTFVSEMLRLLSVSPTNDDVTATHHLAVGILNRRAAGIPVDAQLFAAAVKYARVAVWRFTDIEPIKANLRTFRLLYTFDVENRESYREAIDYWEQVRIDRDHVERLSALSRDGRFIVFDTYARYGMDWGLPVTQPEPPPVTDAAAFIEHWMAEGGEVPSPIVERDGVPAVNGDFLFLGNAIFSAEDVHRHRHCRMRISQAADREFRTLVTRIVTLPGIPPPVASLIRRRADEIERGSAGESQ